MRSVLFVDDEPNVLSGIRRSLRRHRDTWQMEFVTSAQDAIRILDEQPFDVVVSDMRMPGMDGAQLLSHVQIHNPNVIRFMLSGQSDQECIQQAVTRTHQYFTKPCDPESLLQAISRSCDLRDRLMNPSLRAAVARMTSLPSLPQVYHQLMEEFESREPCVRRVGELIEQDVAMTARLLQLINSSYFGFAHTIERPAQAAALLGINTLRPIVLSAAIFSQFEARDDSLFSLEDFSHHSTAVGQAAQRLAAHHKMPRHMVCDTQMAGFVHDVGKLLLATHMTSHYEDMLRKLPSCDGTQVDLELELLGTTHADVGAHLLGLWGLPEPIVEAAIYHHAPRECPCEHFSPLTAIHIADVLVHQQAHDNLAPRVALDVDYLTRVGIIDELSAWERIVDEVIGENVSQA
jgi:HD-like signal output (HDOD) protein